MLQGRHSHAWTGLTQYHSNSSMTTIVIVPMAQTSLVPQPVPITSSIAPIKATRPPISSPLASTIRYVTAAMGPMNGERTPIAPTLAKSWGEPPKPSSRGSTKCTLRATRLC